MVRLKASILIGATILSAPSAFIPPALANDSAEKPPSLAAEAAIDRFQKTYDTAGTVVADIDLTGDFRTVTPWRFVAIQGPSTENVLLDGGDPGLIAMCLAHGAALDCSGPPFPHFEHVDAPKSSWDKSIGNYHSLDARIVFARSHIRSPMLLLVARSVFSANGNQVVSTFALSYDRQANRFVGTFAGVTGKNHNEEIRLVRTGPLAGDIILDEPTFNAPFAYFITVLRSSNAATYSERLHYRSQTRYGDGNPLAVIDSEMPEIMRRLGLWKVGDKLPFPQEMPSSCHSIELRRGVEWCR
ncbi:hypothetical protein GCM10011611_02720 [Aliidongia dinghuensis]|uniref:Uncharacterized protein n=2 Tax=Aliidongia dinghuensis TaxID=1867774 RepID=A0A8J3E1C1_9PROT|nr:hypothetical protein GCM10011611_02720 [Aliidongia dinghuensis]